MDLMKKLKGYGPLVYLLIKSGKRICSGVNGTDKSASFSLGTPALEQYLIYCLIFSLLIVK